MVLRFVLIFVSVMMDGEEELVMFQYVRMAVETDIVKTRKLVNVSLDGLVQTLLLLAISVYAPKQVLNAKNALVILHIIALNANQIII
jgi:hypothetical protein